MHLYPATYSAVTSFDTKREISPAAHAAGLFICESISVTNKIRIRRHFGPNIESQVSSEKRTSIHENERNATRARTGSGRL